MFNRKMFTPALTSWASIAGESVAGPSVAMILVLRMAAVPLWAECISFEDKWRSPGHVRTRELRAPILLDVLDDELGSFEMGNIRPAARIVHRVRHVPQEGNVFSHLHHLPNAEGPAENAHVQVNPGQNHIIDAALVQKIPRLLAVIGNRVGRRHLDRRNLPGPRLADRAFARAIAAHVGI